MSTYLMPPYPAMPADIPKDHWSAFSRGCATMLWHANIMALALEEIRSDISASFELREIVNNAFRQWLICPYAGLAQDRHPSLPSDEEMKKDPYTMPVNPTPLDLVDAGAISAFERGCDSMSAHSRVLAAALARIARDKSLDHNIRWTARSALDTWATVPTIAGNQKTIEPEPAIYLMPSIPLASDSRPEMRQAFNNGCMTLARHSRLLSDKLASMLNDSRVGSELKGEISTVLYKWSRTPENYP